MLPHTGWSWDSYISGILYTERGKEESPCLLKENNSETKQYFPCFFLEALLMLLLLSCVTSVDGEYLLNLLPSIMIEWPGPQDPTALNI